MEIEMRSVRLFLIVLTLAGCVTTHATLVDPTAPRFAPVSPDSVRIFTDQTELDTLEFVRVAIIEASGSGEWTNQSEMLEAMRRKAGELGGNGVLLPRIDEPSAGAKVAAALFGTGTQRKGNVVAVRVLGPKKKTSLFGWLLNALEGSSHRE
jgi:hypothetical protein